MTASHDYVVSCDKRLHKVPVLCIGQQAQRAILCSLFQLLIDMTNLRHRSAQIAKQLDSTVETLVKATLNCQASCDNILHLAVQLEMFGWLPDNFGAVWLHLSGGQLGTTAMELIRILLNVGGSSLVNLMNRAGNTSAHQTVFVATSGHANRKNSQGVGAAETVRSTQPALGLVLLPTPITAESPEDQARSILVPDIAAMPTADSDVFVCNRRRGLVWQ